MNRPEHVRKKHRARMAVDYAVRTGRLVRPLACERCGNIPPPRKDGRTKIQGHHYLGYDHPLDVQWLCAKCHGRELDSYQSHKTHCPRGHEYTVENTYLGKIRGERRCRECARMFDRQRGPGWYRGAAANAAD